MGDRLCLWLGGIKLVILAIGVRHISARSVVVASPVLEGFIEGIMDKNES